MSHEHNHTHGANKNLDDQFHNHHRIYDYRSDWGILTNSLALLADAGHMLSDSISLGVGLLAFILGEKRPIIVKHTDINDLKFLQLYLTELLWY